MSANSLSRSFASLSIGSVRANVGSSSVASSSRVTLNAALPSSSSRHLSHLSVKRPRVAQDASKNLMRGYASAAPVAPLGLSNLKPAQPTKNSKRKGRGPGSGRGGTATRGHKGQKARRGNGKPTPGFAGGQTPLMRRFPKTGFTNIHARDYAPVNLDKIQHWIDSGLLDPSQPIDASYLLHSRCIHQVKDGVKVLGDGAAYLRTPITLIVSRASQSAIQAIEKVGGNVECRYYTDLGLRALVKPHKWTEKGKPLPRDAMPIKKRDLIYYASPNNRGYLAKRAIAATILNQAEKATTVGSNDAPRSAPPPQSTDSGAAETSRKST